MSGVRERAGGRYRFVRRLGRGVRAEVWEVIDEATGARLALKRLTPAADRALRAVFEREYHVLAQLAHASIVEVHDYGLDAQGAPFYTMELLDGDCLDALAPLPWPEVCQLAMSIASALAVLHSRSLVHRDISPDNVRLTSSERAVKLFGFGTMRPMGVQRDIVGAPACVAPEAWHKQPLDGRSDLYSLGALAYFALTGQHAYAGSHVRELPERWRRGVRAPRELDPDIPEALSALVMSLLELDPLQRLGHAGELVAELSAVGALPLHEGPAVRHARLTTPRLVGRDGQLAFVRSQLGRASRGQGSMLLVDGGAGVGRSRFLDACVMEAKLAGAVVLRASAEQGEPYAAMRSLARQLVEEAPQTLHSMPAVLRRNGFGIGSQQDRGHQSASRTPADNGLTAPLCSWFQTISRECFTVIAVDDLHRVDELSVAVLALLAQNRTALGKLAVIATREAGDAVVSSLAAEALARAARAVRLAPLDAAGTYALVEVVLGDSDDVALIAERVHDAAGGNPHLTMELLQRLVDRGALRYESGRWVAVGDLDPTGVTRMAAGVIPERIACLSDTARMIAEVLALLRNIPCDVEEVAAMIGVRDQALVHRALVELVERRIIRWDADRFGFTRSLWVRACLEGMSDFRRTVAHDRIATVLWARQDDPLVVVRHLLAAERVAEGLELLVAELGRGSRCATATRGYEELLQQALDESERLGRPPAERSVLQRELAALTQSLRQTGSS